MSIKIDPPSITASCQECGFTEEAILDYDYEDEREVYLVAHFLTNWVFYDHDYRRLCPQCYEDQVKADESMRVLESALEEA